MWQVACHSPGYGILFLNKNNRVEAVKHFLYGIAIDEGADGLRAISLAWDVLYPEVS